MRGGPLSIGVKPWAGSASVSRLTDSASPASIAVKIGDNARRDFLARAGEFPSQQRERLRVLRVHPHWLRGYAEQISQRGGHRRVLM
jgi:hypothetical protein